MTIEVALNDQTMILEGTTFKVGRHESNAIVVSGPWVSRYHCELRVEGRAIFCLDCSRTGSAILEGEQSIRLAPGIWTNVPLDSKGRGVLVLAGVHHVRLSIVGDADSAEVGNDSEVTPTDETGPRGTLELGSAMRQGLWDGSVASAAAGSVQRAVVSPAVGAPGPSAARRGAGADLLERLVAAGDLDPSEPVSESALVARLLEVVLEIARGLNALDRRFEANERKHGITNPMRFVIASRDPTAWVRALAADKTGPALAARLPAALAMVGRREDALLAAFTSGVRDLFAELDPARESVRWRGVLGHVLDRSLRDYAAFFEELSDGGWHEIVLGRSFVSRVEETVARDE